MPKTKVKKLNKNVQKWLTALRSGKYEKVTCALREEIGSEVFGYCALGVAMKVAEDNGVPIAEAAWGRCFLPNAVKNWLGATSSNVSLNGNTVVDLNDDEGFTFNQIADEIEAHADKFKPEVPNGKAKAKAKAKAKR